MKVLITGHDGFIGKNMMAWMAAEDWDIDGWTWKSNSFPDVKNYQWVIHLGAITDPNDTDIDRVIEQNLEFSQRLLISCQEQEVNLQYASCSSVYGAGKDFSETAPVRPQSPYAWSKYLFDRWAFQQPLNSSLVQGFRYFKVYGKYMHLSNKPNIMSRWRDQARKEGKITVWDNAEFIRRDWVWVGDVCRLHIDFIKTVYGSGIWNCGSGLSHSYLDIAEEIATLENVPIEIISPTKISTPKVCANLTHLKSTIGKRKWLNVFEYLNQ